MKVTGFLFLATLFCVTWEKVQWGFGVDVSISDLLTILFLVSFALEWFARGERRFPRTTAIVLLIFAALLVIYLVGFFNIQTKDSLDQWLKGMVKFFLHFLFLAAGVAYLARRGAEYGVNIAGEIRVDMKKVKARKDVIVANSANGVEKWLRENPKIATLIFTSSQPMAALRVS